MASSWRGAVSEQVELICTRLRQLASSSLRSLQDELGLDLGFKPELYPAWLFGCAALIALLAVGLLLWLAACGGERRRKQQQQRASSSQTSPQLSATATDRDKSPPPTATRSEEPKKRNRKKASEKKTQPNGGAVPEPQQQIKVIQELPKHQPKPEPLQPAVDAKAEKAKKNKKKPKPEVKQPLSVSVTDVKEPDEGAWEKKISNREKRQQRRKEKGDESGSPVAGGRDSLQSEPVPVPAPVITKKNKANKVSNSKTAKPDAIIAPASSSWNGVNSVSAGGRTETSAKISPKVKTLDSEKHVSMNTSGHRNVESMAWAQESEGTWPGMDQRNKRDVNRVYAVLGLNSSAGNSVVKAVDLGKLDGMSSTDEWSGYNGLGTEDSGSDWNAPSEVWGNFEEPKVETPVTLNVDPVSQLARVQESDDDVDKADPSGTGKSKRKRKKKKKTEEESAPAKVAPEVSIAPAASVVKHHPVVPVEETNKQNMTAHSNQKKSDQNREAPKQVQKKKARRET